MNRRLAFYWIQTLSLSWGFTPILIYLFISLPISTSAQTFFLKRSSDIGINHDFKVNDELIGGGAAFLDYNNDGHEDIYLTAGVGRDKLYQNNGDGTFREVGITAGLGITDDRVTVSVATGDIDNDGYREIFVGTSHIFGNLLFYNNGDGTFTEISQNAGISQDKSWSMSVSFGDVNLDGYLDIYVGNYIETDRFLYNAQNEVIGFDHVCYTNYLYLNNGDKTFTEVSGTYGADDWGCALATTFTDFDQDGDVDMLVANDFGEWVVPNRLLRNEYPLSYFADVSIQSNMDVGIYGMGIATGDCDQDGDLDYYVTNLGRNVMLMNIGDGTFSDVTTEAGIEDTYSFTNSLSVGWGTAFADFDNDMDMDLMVSNGHVPSAAFIPNIEASPDKLYLNNGDFTFNDYSQEANANDGSKGRGLIVSDYDNDGDQDYLVIPVNSVINPITIQNVILFQNQLENELNWLKVKLEGTTSNRDAYGAQIRIKVGDKKWLTEIQGGSSHASQNTSIAHFGMGDAMEADSLWVMWPGGNTQVFTNISANQQILIKENAEQYTTHIPTASLFKDLSISPNPFKDQLHINFSLSSASKVKIDLYNALGQQIANLTDELKPAGSHQLSWKSPALDQGVYYFRMEVNGYLQTTKILNLH